MERDQLTLGQCARQFDFDDRQRIQGMEMIISVCFTICYLRHRRCLFGRFVRKVYQELYVYVAHKQRCRTRYAKIYQKEEWLCQCCFNFSPWRGLFRWGDGKYKEAQGFMVLDALVIFQHPAASSRSGPSRNPDHCMSLSPLETRHRRGCHPALPRFRSSTAEDPV